jgi:hypothetical protein
MVRDIGLRDYGISNPHILTEHIIKRCIWKTMSPWISHPRTGNEQRIIWMAVLFSLMQHANKPLRGLTTSSAHLLMKLLKATLARELTIRRNRFADLHQDPSPAPSDYLTPDSAFNAWENLTRPRTGRDIAAQLQHHHEHRGQSSAQRQPSAQR